MNRTTKIIPLLLFLFGLIACKKDKLEPIVEFDITQYYIAGKTNKIERGAFMIHFNSNKIATMVDARSENTVPYTYQNGVLTIIMGTVTYVYHIKDEKIISVEAPPSGVVSETLYKIPESNQIVGKVFKGSWKTEGSDQLTPTTVSWNIVPQPNIMNVATTATDGNERRFWILIDGKLEASKYNSATNKYAAGIFLMQ